MTNATAQHSWIDDLLALQGPSDEEKQIVKFWLLRLSKDLGAIGRAQLLQGVTASTFHVLLQSARAATGHVGPLNQATWQYRKSARYGASFTISNAPCFCQQLLELAVEQRVTGWMIHRGKWKFDFEVYCEMPEPNGESFLASFIDEAKQLQDRPRNPGGAGEGWGIISDIRPVVRVERVPAAMQASFPSIQVAREFAEEVAAAGARMCMRGGSRSSSGSPRAGRSSGSGSEAAPALGGGGGACSPGAAAAGACSEPEDCSEEYVHVYNDSECKED